MAARRIQYLFQLEMPCSLVPKEQPWLIRYIRQLAWPASEGSLTQSMYNIQQYHFCRYNLDTKYDTSSRLASEMPHLYSDEMAEVFNDVDLMMMVMSTRNGPWRKENVTDTENNKKQCAYPWGRWWWTAVEMRHTLIHICRNCACHTAWKLHTNFKSWHW